VGFVKGVVEVTVAKPDIEAGKLVDKGTTREVEDEDDKATADEEGAATGLEDTVMVIPA